MYTAPHSAPALPPTAPAPPAPRRGAHRSCPTEREQFLRYCPCPINWNRCCRVYSTFSPLLPIIYCPCPTARDLCRVVYPALLKEKIPILPIKSKCIIKLTKKLSIFALCSKNRFFGGFLGFYSYVFMINPSLFYKTNQIINRQLKSIIKNEKI